jgi:hypothetical protein
MDHDCCVRCRAGTSVMKCTDSTPDTAGPTYRRAPAGESSER